VGFQCKMCFLKQKNSTPHDLRIKYSCGRMVAGPKGRGLKMRGESFASIKYKRLLFT
jgi:hypothetical protein